MLEITVQFDEKRKYTITGIPFENGATFYVRDANAGPDWSPEIRDKVIVVNVDGDDEPDPTDIKVEVSSDSDSTTVWFENGTIVMTNTINQNQFAKAEPDG